MTWKQETSANVTLCSRVRDSRGLDCGNRAAGVSLEEGPHPLADGSEMGSDGNRVKCEAYVFALVAGMLRESRAEMRKAGANGWAGEEWSGPPKRSLQDVG